MTAREKFRKGDRVQCAAEALAVLVRRPRDSRYGTVVGFGRQPHLVAIIRDGQKTRGAYHMDYWERVEIPEGPDTSPSERG